MNNFIKVGDTVTRTAPNGGVTSGTAYKIGQLLVVAVHDAAEGELFEGKTTGVFTLNKTAGQSWSEGTMLYWNNSTGALTTTASGNLPVGCADEAALSAATTGSVRLNGVALPNAS